MPRNVAIVKTSVWETGSDFRDLHRNAQWAYLMLISQRQINTCGVLPYTPERWRLMACDGTKAGISRAISELKLASFVLVDEQTSELLIRTFIRHDRVWTKPNLVIAARSQYREIISEEIRCYLADSHPWLTDSSLPPSEGVSNGVPEGVSNGVPVRGRARPPASRLLPITPPNPPKGEVQQIYAHWRKARSKTDSRYDRLSPGRRKRIEARLKEFTADELHRAIDAVARDPWPERSLHDDLTTLFRSQEQVDKFLSLERKQASPPCPECGIGGGTHLAECPVGIEQKARASGG